MAMQDRLNNNAVRCAQFVALLLASLVVAMPAASAAESPQHVVLQLKWRHAFQFAGYYAALEQGYYRDAGLDVELVELTGDLSPTELLLQGKADYAVTGADVVMHRVGGAPVVALAAIYQHSPYAFLVREDSGMTRVEDFVGKRIMMGSGQQSADLLATLRRAGLSEADYMRIPTDYDYRSLVDGEVDVYDAYVTDQGHTMEEVGVEGRYILPTHYGVDFYGDVLVTTEKKLQDQPEQVAAFRDASLRGWKYALNHPEELVSLILARYNTQHLSKSHLEYEAITSREMIQPLLLELGYMNPERWDHIRDIFAEEGLIAQGGSLEGFIYRQEPRDPAWLRWAANHERLLLTGATATLLLALALVLLHTRRLVRQRTSALAERERYLTAVIDATPLCVKTVDAAGRLLSMNPAGLAMIDADSYERISGMDASQMVDAEYRARYRDLIRRALAGESGSLLFSAKGLRGRPVWLESYAVPFRNTAGGTNALVVTLDITARKQMEIALEEQHDHLQNLLNSINGISWEFDLVAERFTYVSPNAPRILGYSIAEWTGLDSWLAMIVPEDRETARFYCMSQTAAGRDHLFEYRLQKKNGEIIHMLELVRVIKDADNMPVRIAGFMLDQSNVKQARAVMTENVERFRSMLEGTPGEVLLADEPL